MGSFSLDLERFQAKTVAQVEKAARKIALEAYRRIIMRTPVDSGRARANWICTTGRPWTEIPSLDLIPVNTQSDVDQEVLRWRPIMGPIFLSNNLPYIARLEHGYSKQAPNGMVALTVAEFGGIAEDAAAESQAGTFGGSRAETEMGGAWDIGGAGE